MTRNNQPLWLRSLNALTVLALLLFVFLYQLKLSDWPSYLLIIIAVLGAGVNFVLHFRDMLFGRASEATPEQENTFPASEEKTDIAGK